jgi:hypothetical protein
LQRLYFRIHFMPRKRLGKKKSLRHWQLIGISRSEWPWHSKSTVCADPAKFHILARIHSL